MVSFCNPKTKLLLKEVNKPEFKDEEKIRVNPNFAQPSLRINLIPVKTHKKKTVGPTEEEKKL